MNFKDRFIYIILLITTLTGCYDRDFSTPAQKQIDEYRKIGKMCLIPKDPSSSIVLAETNNKDIIDITKVATPKIPEESVQDVNVEVDSTTMFGLQKDDLVLGNASAKVVVIEYSSPTCLHCGYFHKEILPVLKKKYIDSNKIAYIIRPFISNKQDLDAAILTRCGIKDDYLKIVNILYKKQESWAYHSNYRQILADIGALAGISLENYDKCLQDNTISDYLINNSRAISHVPKFLGTPSFVVDGEFLEAGYSAENLSNLIDKAIKKYGE